MTTIEIRIARNKYNYLCKKGMLPLTKEEKNQIVNKIFVIYAIKI